MKKTLREIADLHSGIYAKPDPSGDVFYVQVRHFDQSGIFNQSLKPDLKLESKSERHLLKSGDVLLAVKGSNNMSVLYQNHMRKAVASSVFMVIRIRDIRIVLPEYLSWFLNHPQTQAWCKSEARGSSLLSLTQESLENLELSILPIAKQIKILETTALMKKEKALQQHIHSLRENRNQHLLLQAINSASQI